MIIGLETFKKSPIYGNGLASSGPGSRYVTEVTLENEHLYIPESWYIQQLVEGGVVGFILFMVVLLLIAQKVYKASIPLFLGCVAIAGMNFWLHAFEAMYVSLWFFILLSFIIHRKFLGTNSIL